MESLQFMKDAQARGFGLITMLLICLGLALGCNEEDKFREHIPPLGMGSLIINNNTLENINLFIDGAFTNLVQEDSAETIDMAPGTYRIVLDSEDSNRTYREYTDILENRLTILHVSAAPM